MMKITFAPQRRDDRLSLHRAGDVLTINGEPFDMSAIPDGATLPYGAVDCEWIAGDVDRIDGVLHVPLILPHGDSAPEATRFPAPVTLTSNGAVSLPAYDEEA